MATAFAVLFFLTSTAACGLLLLNNRELRDALKREREALEQRDVWRARFIALEEQVLHERIRRNLGLRADRSQFESDLVRAFNAFDVLATERKH